MAKKTDIKGGPEFLAPPAAPDHPADFTGDDALLPLADRVELAAGK